MTTSEPITTFGRWLQKRGELPHQYARRQRRDKQAVYALAGIRASRSPSFFRTTTLEAISADTGIPATRLYAEAMDALKHEPRLPRRYTRRKRCAECGQNWADPPSNSCPGCEAYRRHTGG